MKDILINESNNVFHFKHASDGKKAQFFELQDDATGKKFWVTLAALQNNGQEISDFIRNS